MMIRSMCLYCMRLAVVAANRYSRPYRLQVASQLAEAVDSIYALQSRAKIIVAGDFNDYHDSPALHYLYQHHLINISAGAQGSSWGKGYLPLAWRMAKS